MKNPHISRLSIRKNTCIASFLLSNIYPQMFYFVCRYFLRFRGNDLFTDLTSFHTPTNQSNTTGHGNFPLRSNKNNRLIRRKRHFRRKHAETRCLRGKFLTRNHSLDKLKRNLMNRRSLAHLAVPLCLHIEHRIPWNQTSRTKYRE